MREKLEALQKEALEELAGAGDLDALETWRVRVLGTQGCAARAPTRPGRPATGRAAGRRAGLQPGQETLWRALSPPARPRWPTLALEQELAAQRVDVTLTGAHRRASADCTRPR